VVVLIPDLSWMRDAALALASVGAVLGLASVLLGLYSVISGQDHLPKRIRRLLWKVPASVDDHKTRGLALMLNGAAMMLVELGITAGVVGAYDHRSFAADAAFFITVVALLTSLACTAGSYTLSLRVRYVSTRTSTDPNRGIPPA
jgi:hypothetical protein